MDFIVGDTRAPDLSHLLGRCSDLNAISWTLATIKARIAATEGDTPIVDGPEHQGQGFTYSQPLTTRADKPNFLVHHPGRPLPFTA